ncbi:MAG TPA: hypothetical protein VMV10_30295 [Pirellulales bacterium]|nr:hypothetical protein [Pirellulales bacterium]
MQRKWRHERPAAAGHLAFNGYNRPPAFVRFPTQVCRTSARKGLRQLRRQVEPKRQCKLAKNARPGHLAAFLAPSAVVGAATGSLQWNATRFVDMLGVHVESAMNRESERRAGRQSRFFVPLVLIVVAAAIALANLRSDAATIDFLKKTHLVIEKGERPFGWPLTWYWRDGGYASEGPQWPLSRFSAPRLIGNVAMWLATLAGTAAALRWLLRRYRPRRLARPRVSTLILLMFVVVPVVLANLSHDGQPNSWQGEYYGWPLLWYGHIPAFGMFSAISPERREYSAPGLVGDLLVWLLILVVTGMAWEWLVRRYRPRLRWSLKTMLAAVGFVAIVCAWFAGARSRAEKQDALIDLLGGEESFVHSERFFYYVERWGPKWLDVVGADRFRRRIVGALVEAGDADSEQQFERLAPLPDLRFLEMSSSFSNSSVPQFTPAMGNALGGMRQLRVLNVSCENMYGHIPVDSFHECIAAIGKLVQLERLGIHMWEENIDDLACLDKLTNLKSLKLSVIPFADREVAKRLERTGEAAEEQTNREEPRTLAYLPPLPRLEFLNVHEWEFGDQDLGRLARFPRLKSLDLSWTTVGAEGLAKLAPLESLEELAINEDVATSAGFEALIGLKRLKAVHIWGPGHRHTSDTKAEKFQRRADIAAVTLDGTLRPAVLLLDDRSELVVLPGELDGLRRSLAALRKSHSAIVIDAAYEEFEEKNDVEPPWHATDREDDLRAFARQ